MVIYKVCEWQTFKVTSEGLDVFSLTNDIHMSKHTETLKEQEESF